MKEIRIAVVGNPNTGKSTLINALAGSKLQVGNWPGVTVEKKEAEVTFFDYRLRFIDLPGAYSLSPYSLEEKIARDFLFSGEYDVILCVVDSTNFERNLYFVIQLMELERPLVVALNIFDEAIKLGYSFDLALLEQFLGIKVVPTVATKGEGLEDLKRALIRAVEEGIIPKRLSYGEEFEEALERLRAELSRPLSRAVLIKILERDEELLRTLGIKYDGDIGREFIEHIERVHGEDFESFLADVRYGIASGITRQVLTRPEIRKITLTEKLDRIFLNRYLGIPIFLLFMWLLFKISFDVATPYVDFLDETINGPVKKWVSKTLDAMGAPEWLNSLVLDGIVGGVGIVLSFVPVIGMIMLLITFLESSGYMARSAYLMDRIMRSFGVQGKSFIPMLLGFGCNVPSVYASRVLTEEKERKLTIFLVPFMSCGARLPVYVVFAGAFFPQSTGTVIFSLYVLGILVAVIVGILIHRIAYKGVSSPFIMELPPYRIPTFRDLRIHTWMKLRHFLIKAGTWILAVNILIWMLLNLPWKPENPEESLLGKIGGFISPIFRPLGFGDWASASSLLAGTLAKEVVVSTMAQIYGAEQSEKESESGFLEDIVSIGANFLEKTKEAVLNVVSTLGVASLSTKEPEEGVGLVDKLQGHFSGLSAFAFMVFVLLYWPCFVYGIAVKSELGNFKFYGLAIALHTAVAWIVSFVIYSLGRLFGL